MAFEQKILIIGDTTKGLAGPDGKSNTNFCHCPDMADGVIRAGREKFDIICIVIAGLAAQLDSAIKAIRKTTPAAKIILLARMHEEPQARQLTDPFGDAKGIADDYLICPVDISLISNGRQRQCNIAEHAQDKTSTTAELEEKIAVLERLATQDDLTGLKNRRYVRQFLKQILARADAEQMQVTLLIFDIDNFKHYNDAYGHATGDNVLKQTAVMMTDCCRSHDIVGRIGGDEFAVVFWDCPEESGNNTAQEQQGADNGVKSSKRRRTKLEHPRHAFFMAERFRKKLSTSKLSFLGPQGKGSLTISGGLASFPKDGTTAEVLMQQADNAMLEAKKSGKNRIYIVGRP